MGAAAAASMGQPSGPVLAHSAMQLERADSQIPPSWIGFALATMGATGEISQYLDLWPSGYVITATLLISFFGWLYWLLYVYRLHKVLAQATRCAYKISPRRAVWFQLIPIFAWIWAVTWPNRMARFLKAAKPEMRMAVQWPGILVLLGVLFKFSSLRLFILFGVGAYLNRKLQEVIVFNKAVRIARKQRFDLASSAGLGAGFGLILCQAAQQFSSKHKPEQVRDILVIALVSLGIIKFVEPLSEWIQHNLRSAPQSAEPHHAETTEKRSLLLRGAIFLVIVFSSFSHELLSAEISGHMWEAVRSLSAMLIISGGITYAWSAGARRQKATLLGFVSGSGLAMLLVLALFIAFDNQGTAVQSTAPSSVQGKLVHGTMGPALVPWIVGSQVNGSQLNSLSSVAIPLLLWSILGLVGGLAIDRNWGGGSIRHVAISVLTAALIVVLTLRLANLGNDKQIALGASAVLGWCLSLLIYPAAEKVLRAA